LHSNYYLHSSLDREAEGRSHWNFSLAPVYLGQHAGQAALVFQMAQKNLTALAPLRKVSSAHHGRHPSSRPTTRSGEV